MEGWVDLGYPSMHRPGTESDALTTAPPSRPRQVGRWCDDCSRAITSRWNLSCWSCTTWRPIILAGTPVSPVTTLDFHITVPGSPCFHPTVCCNFLAQLFTVKFRLHFAGLTHAQYTPPKPTRLNCRVESRRRCVLNSQLVHDGFGRKSKTERVKNLSIRAGCSLQNWKLGHDCRRVSTLHTAQHTELNSTQLDSTCSVFSFQFF